MIRLSVNINKIATLRNSRGGSVPAIGRAVETCLDAGAQGITVHPRADERHVRASDVDEIAEILRRRRAGDDADFEFNIEGDPRPDLIDLVLRTRPDQCTLVPVVPGEITSQAGWAADGAGDQLPPVVDRLKAAGVRVSLFVDPQEAAMRWAVGVGADRVELYTEPFARALERGTGEGQASLSRYAAVSRLAHDLGLGVNAGHDLDLTNLPMFRELPYLAEVSIGHALISDALWMGLDRAVRAYVDVLAGR
jgi:pyridoxine 5-phosphate synthase